MEYILVVVAMIVVLTAFDAGSWPKNRKQARVCRTSRRLIPRRRARRPATHTYPMLGLAPRLRWWWE